jgi:TPR repeat protein
VRDDRQAIKWLTIAAEAGNAFALFNLAKYYSDGTAVPVDRETAAIASVASSLTGQVTEYIVDHPELKEIVEDFVRAVLEAKPADLLSFAQGHFCPPLAAHKGQATPGVGAGAQTEQLGK